MPKSGPTTQPKVAAHEKRGDHLAAFESGGERHGREEDLQKESGRSGASLLHRRGDDVHSRAVIIRRAAEIGQGDDRHAADRHPHPGVGDAAGHLMLGKVDGIAKQDGHQGAQGPQHRHPQQHHRLQSGHVHGEAGGCTPMRSDTP